MAIVSGSGLPVESLLFIASLFAPRKSFRVKARYEVKTFIRA